MTEQQPRPIDLTKQANPHRLEDRGDIFMAEGSTATEQAPRTANEAAEHLGRMKQQREREASGEQGQKREASEGEEERRRFLTSFRTAFMDAGTRAELGKDLPNFSKEKASVLNEFMQEHMTPDSRNIRMFSQQIAYAEEVDIEGQKTYVVKVPDENGRPVDVIISPKARELLYEWTLEKIIGLPDYGPEDIQYQLPSSIEIQYNQATLEGDAVAMFGRDFVERFKTLNHVRPMMHELKRLSSKSEKYSEYVVGLETYGLDFVRNNVSGVATVISMLEQAATYRVSATKAFSEGDVAQVEKDVDDAMHAMQDKGTLKDIDGRVLTDWEVVRALKFGKAFFAGLQRFAMYGSLGELQPQATGRVGSVPFEFIVRKLQGLKFTAVRYWGSEKGPGRMLQRTLRAIERLEKGEFTRSLFGIDKDVMLVNNQFTTPDIESHGWRSQLMFPGNIDLKLTYTVGEGDSIESIAGKFGLSVESLREANDIAGDTNIDVGTELKLTKGNEDIQTLLDFIDKVVKENHGTVDEALGFQIDSETDKDAAAAKLEVVLLGQKLYLSEIIRNDALSQGLKIKLFEKIATLNPLRTASLKPELLTPAQRELLGGIRQKFYLANNSRVNTDAEYYFDSTGKNTPQSMESLAKEAKKYQDLRELEKKIVAKGKSELSVSEQEGYDKAVSDISAYLDVSSFPPELQSGERQRRLSEWKQLLDRIHAEGKQKLTPDELVEYNVLVNGKSQVGDVAAESSVKYRILEYFNDENGNALDENEKQFVRYLIDSGYVLSKDFATTRLAFAVCVDDAPKVAYKKRGLGASIAGLGDPNLIRIMGSDQPTFGKGIDALNAWIENPVENYDKNPVEAVQNIARVIGRSTASNKVRPVMDAFIEMSTIFDKAKYIGGLMRSRLEPRSEMEEYYIDSNLAWDADQREAYIRSEGQHGAIMTEAEKNGKKSMMMEMLQEHKADRKARAKMSIRRIIMLLFPFLGVEFMKMLVPEGDAFKSVK